MDANLSLNQKSFDDDTTVAQLKALVGAFCSDRQWDAFHSPKDLAIGAVTESAELLEIFRFQSAEDCDRLILSSGVEREKIADEIADVLFFVLRFAQKYDFDLATIFNAKMQKNAEKYPVDKARGSNKKYTELK